MRLFDTYVIVDWSAANAPKHGRDSIWICRHGPNDESIVNPRTRQEALALIAEMLAGAMIKGDRVLAGFDFPFGYPAGFADRLGFDGEQPWRAVWDEIARLIEDGPNNKNNRFKVGAELNRRVSSEQFPFWGCPVGAAHDFLSPHYHRGHKDGEPLAERRLIDTWMIGAQSCWKLAYTGSVGSQVLTGIPVVRALRDDPRWADRARIWPFETGLQPPADDVRIVFAEVWPSWWPEWKKAQRPGEVNDLAQVRHVARTFAASDRTNELQSWFAPAIGHDEARPILAEEAWTLGVMRPRRRVASRRIVPHPDPLPACGEREGSAPEAREGEGQIAQRYTYLRDPAAIYRRSLAVIRKEVDLGRFPRSLRPLAVRLAHAAGDGQILADLAWSKGAVSAGRRALAGGAAILVDSTMAAAGIIADRLPAQNPIICTLRDPATAALARRLGTTRSAAAVELWRPHLAGAVVAIGNAPTALFHLLELLAAGAGKPALVLGFPVGFVGAAEAKAALAGFGRGLAFVSLHGRRGGSALAAAAVNALAGEVRR